MGLGTIIYISIYSNHTLHMYTYTKIYTYIRIPADIRTACLCTAVLGWRGGLALVPWYILMTIQLSIFIYPPPHMSIYSSLFVYVWLVCVPPSISLGRQGGLAPASLYINVSIYLSMQLHTYIDTHIDSDPAGTSKACLPTAGWVGSGSVVHRGSHRRRVLSLPLERNDRLLHRVHLWIRGGGIYERTE